MGKLVLIAWPSFLSACLAEFVFFSLVDPKTLYLFGEPVHYSSMATYSIGFFAFWVLCALSSWGTLFFGRSSQAINVPDLHKD